jgi:putative transposase
MVYIDLNMVRAGVVPHPSEWPFCGYHEILNTRQRYTLIDHESLTDLFNISSKEELRKTYRGWVEESLETWGRERQPRWTKSIAVGDEGFVGDVKGKLGIRAMGREVIGVNGSYELREPETSYEAIFWPENGDLRDENRFYPDKQKTPRSNREDECASVWSGCRPTGAVIRDHGLARGAPLGRYFLKINKLTWSDPEFTNV